MASRRNPKITRRQAKAKALSDAAARGWETRRKNAARGLSSPAFEGAPTPLPAADIQAVRRSLLSGFRLAQLGAIRNGLGDVRTLFLQSGDAHAARRITRLIADFDFLSKRLPPVR